MKFNANLLQNDTKFNANFGLQQKIDANKVPKRC